MRPWAPPDNQQLVKTCKDPSVVTPPRYDTNPHTPPARGRKIVWHHRDTGETGETQIWVMDGHQLIGRGTVLGEDGNPAFVWPPFEIVGVGAISTSDLVLVQPGGVLAGLEAFLATPDDDGLAACLSRRRRAECPEQ